MRPEHGVYGLRDQNTKVGGDTGLASTYRSQDALQNRRTSRYKAGMLVEMQLVNNSMHAAYRSRKTRSLGCGILSIAYIETSENVYVGAGRST